MLGTYVMNKTNFYYSIHYSRYFVQKFNCVKFAMNIYIKQNKIKLTIINVSSEQQFIDHFLPYFFK